MSSIHLEHTPQGLYTLTMTRPDNFNALSGQMLTDMQAALDRVAADSQSRVLVISAQGKAFCAGHNLKDMAANPQLAFYQQLFAQCAKMMVSIAKLSVPVIARVQGIATAAGCQLVAQCDLAVASPSARFATSGIHYGLFCSTPSVPLVRSIASKRAAQMLMMGDFIDAKTALDWGLINAVASDDSPQALDDQLHHLVDGLLAKPRLALQMGKELLRQQQGMGLEAAYQLAGQTMACNMMDETAQEGVNAFVGKRKPNWSSSL